MPSFVYMSPSGESKEVPLDQIKGVEDLVSIAREVHQIDKPTEKATKHRVWATLPNGKRVTCLTFKNHRYLVASSHPNTKLGVQWYEDKAKAEKRTKFLNSRPYKMVSYPYPFVVVPVTREDV